MIMQALRCVLESLQNDHSGALHGVFGVSEMIAQALHGALRVSEMITQALHGVFGVSEMITQALHSVFGVYYALIKRQ